MDLTLIGLIIAAIVVALTIFIINRINKSKENKEGDKPKPAQRQQQQQPATAANRATAARNRLRNRLQARNQANDGDEEIEEINQVREYAATLNRGRAAVEDVDDDGDDNEGAGGDGNEEDADDWASRETMRKKIGTKKLAKMEAKAEKKEMHQQMLREREERKERERILDEERKKREEEERQLEKEKEEEEKRLKEEQEKREYEEYLKLKQQFTVDEEGHEEVLNDSDKQNLLQEFVDYIKKMKVILIEDLASEFKLKTQDTIERINQVQQMGLLTGVLDDRGKYIFISQEELQKICIFIRQRGRVSINELAQASNELINLKSNDDISNQEILINDN